ncbi:hypothetical protein A8B78_11865 [Jannaschia sp. EhC01]|nr:hypothetical protein A8B78_11865 [Jannaschia sp. EhC01]
MTSLIRWFLNSPVAANLLMAALLFAGISAALNLTVRTFPEINTGAVTVTVVYPGATPAEVADTILTPIEQQLTGLEGVRGLDGTAQEDSGTVTVQATRGTDLGTLQNNIETAIARITTFPEAAQSPASRKCSSPRLPSNSCFTAMPHERTSRHWLSRFAMI